MEIMSSNIFISVNLKISKSILVLITVLLCTGCGGSSVNEVIENLSSSNSSSQDSASDTNQDSGSTANLEGAECHPPKIASSFSSKILLQEGPTNVPLPSGFEGVAYDATEDQFYIVDKEPITVFSGDGLSQSSFSVDMSSPLLNGQTLETPSLSGIDLHPDGDLVVVDRENGMLYKIDRTGTIKMVINVPEDSAENVSRSLNSVSVNSDGTKYSVYDTKLDKVLILNDTGILEEHSADLRNIEGLESYTGGGHFLLSNDFMSFQWDPNAQTVGAIVLAEVMDTGSDDIPNGNEKAREPEGLDFNESTDTMYIVDDDNPIIHVITSNADLNKTAASLDTNCRIPKISATLDSILSIQGNADHLPSGVDGLTYDINQNLFYVVSSSSGEIGNTFTIINGTTGIIENRVTLDYTTNQISTENKITYQGLALAPNGNLLMAGNVIDTPDTIYVTDTTGVVLQSIQIPELEALRGIVVSADGSEYMMLGKNFMQVVIYDSTWNFIREISILLPTGRMTGLANAEDGHFFLSNDQAQKIEKIDNSGSVVAELHLSDFVDASVEIDSDALHYDSSSRKLFVGDDGGNKIYIFQL